MLVYAMRLTMKVETVLGGIVTLIMLLTWIEEHLLQVIFLLLVGMW